MGNFKLRVSGLVLIGIASVWAFHQAVLLPEVTKKAVLKTEIRQVEHQIQKTRSAFPDLRQSQRGLEVQAMAMDRIRKKILALDTKILGTEDVRILLGGNLSGEAERPHRTSPYAREFFDLVALGPYDAIAQYLDRIEKSSPFLRVESLRLSREEPGIGDSLEAEITVGAIHSGAKDGSLMGAENQPQNFTFQGIQDPFVRS